MNAQLAKLAEVQQSVNATEVYRSDGIRLYGLDAELELKKQSKRNPQYEKEISTWIEQASGQTMEFPDDIVRSLKSGIVLCRLINALQPGTIKTINTKPIALMEVENIQLYLKGCWKLGVPSSDLFVTSDLFNQKDIPQVLQNIVSLARVAQTMPNYKGPKFGAKLSAPAQVKKWETIETNQVIYATDLEKKKQEQQQRQSVQLKEKAELICYDCGEKRGSDGAKNCHKCNAEFAKQAAAPALGKVIGDLREAKLAYNQLQDRYNKLDETSKIASGKLQQMMQQAEENKAQVEKLKAKLEKLEEEKLAQEAKVNQLQQKITLLEGQVVKEKKVGEDKTKAELSSNSALQDKLRKIETEKEKQAQELNSNITQLQEKMKKIEAEKEKVAQEQAGVQKKYQEAAEKVKKLEEKLKKAENALEKPKLLQTTHHYYKEVNTNSNPPSSITSNTPSNNVGATNNATVATTTPPATTKTLATTSKVAAPRKNSGPPPPTNVTTTPTTTPTVTPTATPTPTPTPAATNKTTAASTTTPAAASGSGQPGKLSRTVSIHTLHKYQAMSATAILKNSDLLTSSMEAELDPDMLKYTKDCMTEILFSKPIEFSDVFVLKDLFGTDAGRRQFTRIMQQTMKEIPSLLLSDNSFELLLYLVNTVLKQMDSSEGKDLISAKVLMTTACALSRRVDKHQEFMRDYIKGFEIWKNLRFWEDYFWAELTKKHRKKFGENITSVNKDLTLSLLSSFVYNMMNWGVPVDEIKKFVVDMASRNHLQEADYKHITTDYLSSLVRFLGNEGESGESKKTRSSSLSSGSGSGSGSSGSSVAADIVVVEVNNEHDFKDKSFSRPTFCRHCNQFIWGLTAKQGLKCTVCKCNIHKKCLENFSASSTCAAPLKEPKIKKAS